MSRSSLLTMCALALSLAACSGGQQSAYTPASSPGNADAGSTQLQPQATATSSATIQTSGSIENAYSGGFTLETGAPHGYINVATSSSTQITGRAPYTGELVSVTALGSWSTSLKALTVTQSGAATAGPSAPPSGPVKTHIATWAKDLYWSAGANGSAAAVQKYVTYAQGGQGNAKASSDCTGSNGCSSVFYFDPNSLYDTVACGAASEGPYLKDILASANETWYVHLKGYSDSAHRVRGSYTESCNGKNVTIPVYAMNSLSPSFDSFYSSFFHANAAAYNYFLMDDTSSQVLTQFYGAGGGFCWNNPPNHYCTATQEMPTDASVAQEHDSLANSLTHPNGSAMTGFFNGLNFTNSEPNDLNIIQSGGHFIGALCEDCVVNSGTFRPTMYATVLNSMAKLDAMPNAAFVELNHGESPLGSAAQIAQRTITTAIAWLGYSEGHTIVYPDLEANTENLAAFPENSIYPMSPLETMTSGATDIQVAPGVYRREFGACYNAGVAIGPCASIVNSTSATITVSSAWLRQTYGHIVTMRGGDAPSGGTISLTSAVFKANSTTLAPAQGLLIVR